MSELLAIPGMVEAVERELTIWDAAFLPVNESIAGFEVRPMTLTDFLILQMIKSPLLYGATPSPLELIAFLWVLSPDYTPKGERARRRFVRSCRMFLPPSQPWIKTKRAMAKWEAQRSESLSKAARVVDEARVYIGEIFQDRPPQRGESQDSYYSNAASMCALFGREFGWTRQETMGMPMKQMFQFFKELRQHHRPKAPMFKPSDRVSSKFLTEQNQKAGLN